MNVKKQIEVLKEELTKYGEHLGSIDFDGYHVTLGINGIYYVGNDDMDICISDCESEDECICSRKFPNGFSFFSIDEVANFIVLNFYDGQSAYKNKY